MTIVADANVLLLGLRTRLIARAAQFDRACLTTVWESASSLIVQP